MEEPKKEWLPGQVTNNQISHQFDVICILDLWLEHSYQLLSARSEIHMLNFNAVKQKLDITRGKIKLMCMLATLASLLFGLQLIIR